LKAAIAAQTALMAEHPKLTFFELKNSFILFSFNDLNGGDGGSRTRVHDISKNKSFTSLFSFNRKLKS
jgi:hypothetical protein